MRLLVADDEVNLAKALQTVLEDAGYNCDVWNIHPLLWGGYKVYGVRICG